MVLCENLSALRGKRLNHKEHNEYAKNTMN